VVTAPTTAAPRQAAQSYSGGGLPAIFQCIIQHESGGNPRAVNPGSGAAGLFQFLPSTWHSLGYSGSAANYPPSVQYQAAAKLYAQSGTRPWAGDGCV
jgi:SLT domain-containing protein